MRSNNVPTIVRIKRRLDRLRSHLDNYLRRIGRGNPYWECKYCHISQPELSYRPHHKGCPVPGWAKEIVHYQNVLMDEMKITDPDERQKMMESAHYSLLSHAAMAHLIKKDGEETS